MPKNATSVLSNSATRRVFAIALVAILTLLVMFYGILWFFAQQQQQSEVETFLSDVASSLNHKISHKERNFAQLYITPAVEIEDYELLVFTPDHKIIAIQKYESNYITKLPTWKYDKLSTRQVYRHLDGFEAWYPLHDHYRLYANVRFASIFENFNNPIYALPILWGICLLLLISIQLKKRQRNWQELTLFLQNLPQNLSQGYRSLQIESAHYHPEMRQLTQLINRSSYKLTQYFERYSELTYRQNTLINNAPVALFLISRKGKLLYFNEQFAHLFGTPYDSRVTYMLTDFITGIDKETQQLLINLKKHQLFNNLSVTNLQHDIYFDLFLKPFYNRYGSLKGFSGGLQIVTQYHEKLKKAWLDDKNYNVKIANFDKLWAVLGHELRTPLSGMIGMIDLLNEDKDKLNQEQQETLVTLQQSSQTMLQLLNDMLDMAKMDAGKLQINITSVNLVQLIRQVSDLMLGNAKRNNISLYLIVDPMIPHYINSDDGRLRQILLNLMSNAVKFTKQGYVALMVDKLTGDHPIIQQKLADRATEIVEHWLRITVKDTGIGILPKDQLKLFSYFNQANDSISRQFGGTGLGLAISNNFSQMLGGFIHLKSEAGKGSEFQVFLPLQKFSMQYAFDFRISHLKVLLIIISPYDILQSFNRFLHYYDIPGMVITEINQVMVDKINAIKLLDLTPIFLIDDVAYIGHEALFRQITIFSQSSKILASMENERNLPSELLVAFDGFIQKPVGISVMLAEISRIYYRSTNPNQQLSSLPAETAFRQFLKQHTNLINQPVDNVVTNNDIAISDKAIIGIPQKRILIAEDNPVNQKIAQKHLTTMGYEVMMADNGEIAIEMLEKYRNDIGLVLMDCRMPILDGIEATRIIRSKKDSVPIIALTANDTDEDRNICIQAGMDNFITKPINRYKLENILKRYWI